MSNNFHTGSGPSQDYLYDIDVPTPSHAERARTLAAQSPSGTLCTIAGADSEQPGYPYGSLVTTAVHDGHPIFLISGLAEHTQNLRCDSRASLLLTENGNDSPLALGRVTLIGDCAELEADELEGPRAGYLSVHPEAEYYLDYGDFSFWRLKVNSLRYIGGFGRMSWVTSAAWQAAAPDPLAAHANGIIEHMNADHVEAMTTYCQAFSKAREFSDVQMTGVDSYGFEMSVETAAGWRPVRLGFETPIDKSEDVREALVAMGARARAKLATLDG
ncbi:MAG: putative heme iron utilization protein [Gammaproteobacteria bacterium]|jgi:putative heme iron utilization protein